MEVDDMDFANYQFRTKLTAVYPKEQALEYLTLGLVSEAGEVAGKVKKLIRDHNSELTDEQSLMLQAEIGDVLWYISELCTLLKVNMATVARTNIDKLSKRQEANTLHGSGDNR
jgi:NTP pyrophosphatase (non-canonical NTP hydrolase)